MSFRDYGTDYGTPYGRKAKRQMRKANMSMSELARAVRQKSGLYCDSQYLYKIFTGKRNAPKIVETINEILDTAIVAGKLSDKTDSNGG